MSEIKTLPGIDGASYTLCDSVARGQLTTLQTAVDTLNDGGLVIKDTYLTTQINTWLSNHPEATTTVQDNSLTMDKLVVGTLGYVTPEMYGAAGDGATDDTASVITALKASVESGLPLYLQNKYYITSTLLDISYLATVHVNIRGAFPTATIMRHSTDNDSLGVLVVAEGVDLFDGITIIGSISNIGIVTTATSEADAYTTGSIFKDCVCHGLKMSNCCVSRIGRVFVDTQCEWYTKISNCIFWNINNFCKCTDEKRFMDSVIEGCYINGGKLQTSENDCFEWQTWNGSVVRGNFIDYYRCIYYPIAPNANIAYFPVSIGNNYQVFMYLYYAGLTSGVNGTFIGDAINWTNDSDTISSTMSRFTPFTYTGHDGNTYDVPRCVFWYGEKSQIVMTDIVLQNNIGNAVFVHGNPSGYENCVAKMSVAFNYYPSISRFSSLVSVPEGGGLWTGGSYKYNVYDLPFIHKLASVPSFSGGWTSYYLGQRILVNGVIYRLLYDATNAAYTWVEQYC